MIVAALADLNASRHVTRFPESKTRISFVLLDTISECSGNESPGAGKLVLDANQFPCSWKELLLMDLKVLGSSELLSLGSWSLSSVFFFVHAACVVGGGWSCGPAPAAASSTNHGPSPQAPELPGAAPV